MRISCSKTAVYIGFSRAWRLLPQGHKAPLVDDLCYQPELYQCGKVWGATEAYEPEADERMSFEVVVVFQHRTRSTLDYTAAIMRVKQYDTFRHHLLQRLLYTTNGKEKEIKGFASSALDVRVDLMTHPHIFSARKARPMVVKYTEWFDGAQVVDNGFKDPTQLTAIHLEGRMEGWMEDRWVNAEPNEGEQKEGRGRVLGACEGQIGQKGKASELWQH
ncbi:hypothetical protein BC835DRAFT_1306323 [Cytidiella melzeri]|nr:hypothetical protein BC835DRAFT_1306323 [Cytidiella melzeri]